MTGFKIHFKNVGCRYTIRQKHLQNFYHDALIDINFTLTEGEKLGVIGLNGAGKSSLLRLLSGTLHPTSGSILYEGRPNCALLSLSSRWYPDLSGKENAILSCMMGGLRKKEAISCVPAIMEFAELGPWMDRPIRTYSSGMSTRLALAAALQVKPDVLLLDETLSVGDAKFREKAKRAVLETIGKAKSVVLVSHEVAALKSICSRLLWLDSGYLKIDGSTEEVLNIYQK